MHKSLERAPARAIAQPDDETARKRLSPLRLARRQGCGLQERRHAFRLGPAIGGDDRFAQTGPDDGLAAEIGKWLWLTHGL